MDSDREMPRDAIARQACDFTGRWLRKHGIETGDVRIYESLDGGKSVDVIALNASQFVTVPVADYDHSVSDLLGESYLVFISLPPAS